MILAILLAVPLTVDVSFVEGLAAGAPPEIHAAALLRLSESAGLPAKQKQELIEKAFSLASQAKELYPRLPIYGAPPDTVDAYRNAASQLRLDRLSLQSRAIWRAQTLDRSKLAADLTQMLERPKPGKLSCEAGSIPDLAEYFQVTGRANLAAQIADIESTLELAALASAVSTEEQALALAAKLPDVAADSRAFAASWESLRASLAHIRDRFPSPQLHEAIRDFVIGNLNATRCADSGHVLQSARDIVDWFNSGGEVRPIREADLKPAKAEGRVRSESYWEDSTPKALMDQLRLLRFSASTGLPIPLEQRKSTEWKQELDDFLARLRAANPGFHQTTALLQALIEFTPPGPDRDRMVNTYIDTLRTSDLQQKSPAEWLWRADSLYRMLLYDPDRPKLDAAFRNSNVPALVLYAWFVEHMGSAGMF
jgi:hypothetical protein